MAQSQEYQDLLTKMHKENRKWGAEFKNSPIPQILLDAIEKYKPKTILDFGCGKGTLTQRLDSMFPDITVTGWDPSHGTELTGTYDMIISTDVLEHIEPEYVEETVKDLCNRANVCHYHLIACYEATAILPDGRNAHLTIMPPSWWQLKFLKSNVKIINEVVDVVLKDRLSHDELYTENNVSGKKIVLNYELVIEK